MNWPFVSRETLDRLLAAKDDRLADRDATIATLAAELRLTQDRERVLVQKMVEPPKPIQIPRKEPSPVDTAIAFRSSGDRALRGYLTDYARKMRIEGLDEAEIAQRILHGEQVSDEVAVDD